MEGLVGIGSIVVSSSIGLVMSMAAIWLMLGLADGKR